MLDAAAEPGGESVDDSEEVNLNYRLSRPNPANSAKSVERARRIAVLNFFAPNPLDSSETPVIVTDRDNPIDSIVPHGSEEFDAIENTVEFISKT